MNHLGVVVEARLAFVGLATLRTMDGHLFYGLGSGGGREGGGREEAKGGWEERRRKERKKREG